MTELDVKIFLLDCLKLTARHSRISDIDWKSFAEIRDELKVAHPETYKALETFGDTYFEWWTLTEETKSISRTRSMSPAETQSVLDMTTTMESKRIELRKTLGLLD